MDGAVKLKLVRPVTKRNGRNWRRSRTAFELSHEKEGGKLADSGKKFQISVSVIQTKDPQSKHNWRREPKVSVAKRGK